MKKLLLLMFLVSTCYADHYYEIAPITHLPVILTDDLVSCAGTALCITDIDQIPMGTLLSCEWDMPWHMQLEEGILVPDPGPEEKAMGVVTMLQKVYDNNDLLIVMPYNRLAFCMTPNIRGEDK